MSTLALIATEVAKPMVEHSLRHGATHLNTDFIGAQSAELAVAIDHHLKSKAGEHYEDSKVCLKSIDAMIGKYVENLHALLHKAAE